MAQLTKYRGISSLRSKTCVTRAPKKRKTQNVRCSDRFVSFIDRSDNRSDGTRATSHGLEGQPSRHDISAISPIRVVETPFSLWKNKIG